MTELLVQEPDWHDILRYLLEGGREGAVILFTNPVASAGRFPNRLIAFDYLAAPESSYLKRAPLEAQLSPEFVAEVVSRAKREGQGLVFVHSHPGEFPPDFSQTDNDGEAQLAEFLERRGPSIMHAAIVVSRGGVCARELGAARPIPVVSIGTTRQSLFDPATRRATIAPEHDRQVLALGRAAQEALGRLRVGIVGLGGTGSVVVEQLSHLGVTNYILVDHDTVDATNLNRLAGATAADIGAPKSRIASRQIRGVRPDAAVEELIGDVMHAKVAKRLTDADVVFCCTDSHGSRAVVQQVAYQYLVPTVDMGVTIVVEGGRISHAVGRTQLLAPGLPCLSCSGLLDSNQVRQDMMTDLE